LTKNDDAIGSRHNKCAE